MTRSDTQRVEDILEIAQTLSGLVGKGEDHFRADIVNQWAVERALQNIGEACTKISEEFKSANPTVDWKSIMGMRTYLAHAYHRIDEDIVWDVASIDVPHLVKQLNSL